MFDKNCFYSDLVGYDNVGGPTQDLSPNSTGDLGYPRNVFEWKDSNVRNFKFSWKTPSIINSKLSEGEPKQIKDQNEGKADVNKVEEITTPNLEGYSPGNSEITDALDRLFNRNDVKKPTKKYSVELAVRKDVVNKNIFRIVSRYYKSLMTQYFPKHKTAFKNAQDLELLLGRFCSIVFPGEHDEKLKYTLGAFWFAPKMKILDVSTEVKHEVSQIHKVLSKYTHKDMEKLHSISTIGLIYSSFASNGFEYFQAEETVQKHSQVYFKALEQLKSKFIPQGATLPASL